MGYIDPELVALRRQQIVTMTRLGKSGRDIADILGITRRSVQRHKKAAGVSEPPATTLTREELDRAQQLLDEGCSRIEVCRTLGRSERAINHHFPGRRWSRDECSQHVAMLRRARKMLA